MTISGRLAMLFKAKAPRVLDRAEDPRETLGYSYQKQLDLLQQVRRGVAEVATSRERLELQAEQLSASADTLQQQAAQAVSAGREDLARDALTRRSASLEQLTDLGRRHASLQAQEAKLTSSAQRLKSKVQAFRAREETIKATYTPAEAQIKMGEAFSGISEEMADVGLAMRRAEDKTTQLQARAGATDELIAPGSLDVASGPAQDPVQAERDQMSAHSHDQFELARLKAALPAGGTPVAISAGPHDCDTATPPQTEPAADPFHSAENQR